MILVVGELDSVLTEKERFYLVYDDFRLLGVSVGDCRYKTVLVGLSSPRTLVIPIVQMYLILLEVIT